MLIKQIIKNNRWSIKCPHTMSPVGLVIHNTANDASAKNEIAYMERNDNQVSFHIAIDDIEAIQAIEFNRNAWHAGDGGNGQGNRNYIAIEICYSKSGGSRFTEAEKRAAKEVAELLKSYGWGIDTVKAHRDFMNKDCPHRTNMNAFKELIKSHLNSNNNSNSTTDTQSELYRVRPSWNDSTSQKGAYSNLENAKRCANENKGYFVFNNAGIAIHPVVQADNWVSELQKELNRSYNANLIVDGIIGSKTLAACPILREKAKGTIVTLLQKRLISKNFSCGSFGADGSFGSGTKTAVINFQKQNKLETDGIVGKNTWTALAK